MDAAEKALVRSRRQDAAAGSIALLFAGGTLVCCALPIILVSVGLGTAVVALTNAAPSIVWLSAHKAWVFAGSGAVLTAAALIMLRSDRACPADPTLARICARADRWNRRMLWSGIAVWAFGFFMAYVLLPVRQLLH